MKLKYVLLSGLFMSVGFAACTNDDFTEVQTPAVNTEDAISLGEGYTITVANGDADTRAYMEDLQTPVWEETDQLGAAWYNMIPTTAVKADGTIDNTKVQAFTESSNNIYSTVRLFSLDSYVGDSKKAANFKTTEQIGAGAYVLYYPYESGQLNTAGALTVSMLDEEGDLPAQTMDCNDVYAGISSNIFAYSPVAFLNGGAQSTTENFTLKQLTNVFAIKFQVTASDIFKLVKDVKIAKVIISAKDANGSVIPAEGTIEVPTVNDYNTGKIGEAKFEAGTETADMLIADVANATDAYSIQVIDEPTEAYYISTLPFSGDATSFTVQMLTEEGEVFEKTYTAGDVLNAINKLAQKEGQLIQLTVTLEDLVDTKTIFTADQFKAQWEDALTAKDGATLNVAQPLDLSDMDLTIDNEVADITIKGEAVTVKSVNITKGALTIDNELTVAEDVTVGSDIDGLATGTNGKLNVEGEMNVEGTTGELTIGEIATLTTTTSGEVTLKGADDKAALGTVANRGIITLSGEVAIAEELTNDGTLTINSGATVKNNGVVNQNKTVSGNGTFNNNAGAELNINATTKVKFVNAAKTTKADAAVINVAKGATLTASTGSSNAGVINVEGTLTEGAASALTQTSGRINVAGTFNFHKTSTGVSGGNVFVSGEDAKVNNTPTGSQVVAREITSGKAEDITSATETNLYISGDYEITSLPASKNFYLMGGTITLKSDVTVSGGSILIAGNVTINQSATGGKATLTLYNWSGNNSNNKILAGGKLTLGKGVTLDADNATTFVIEKGGDIDYANGTIGNNVTVNLAK